MAYEHGQQARAKGPGVRYNKGIPRKKGVKLRPFHITYEYQENVANHHRPPRMVTVREVVTVYDTSKENARAGFTAKYHDGGGVKVVSVTDVWGETK